MPSNYSLTNGVSGGRTITGGTGTTDVLNLKGTSGNATTTVPAINLYGGNNGGTLLASFLNNGNIGFGTNDPASYLSGTHGAVIYGTYPSISLSDASDRWMIFKDITGQLEFYSSVLGGAKVIFTNTGYMNFDGSMYFSTENDNAFGNGDGYIKFKSGYNLLHQNTSHNLVFDVYNGGLQKTAMTIFNNGTIEMGKIKGSSSTPSITAGVGAGTSPTVSITGTDMAGQIIVTPGTGCTVGQIVRITFSNSFTSIPYVVFSPANDNAGDIFTVNVNVSIYVTSSTTYFDLIISPNSDTLFSMVQYKWNYLVVQ
jgi:hypothetical protein